VGTVTLQPDGSLIFDPATDVSGPVAFDYTVSDGTASAVGTIDVDIAPINDAPIANDDTHSTPEDTLINLDLIANDNDPDAEVPTINTIDGQPISVGNSVTVSDGTVTLQPDGTLDFVPAANFNGTTDFTYGITDTSGATDTALSTVIVDPVNDAPLVSNDNVVTDEETPVAIDPRINDSDVEGSPLTISAIDGMPIAPGSTVNVTGGSVTMQVDGSLSFTPAPNFFGPTQFSYAVTDVNGASSTATVDITVNGTEDPPMATNDSLVAQEDTPLLLDLLSNDVDPDNTTLQITEIDGQPIAPGGSVPVANGSVVMAPDGSVQFVPDPDVNGPASFTYTVTDPTGLTSTATADLIINPTPDAPEPVDDVITIDEDGAAPLSLIANDSDPDGEPLTLSEINGTPVEPGDTVIVDNGSVTVGDNGQVTFMRR